MKSLIAIAVFLLTNFVAIATATEKPTGNNNACADLLRSGRFNFHVYAIRPEEPLAAFNFYIESRPIDKANGQFSARFDGYIVSGAYSGNFMSIKIQNSHIALSHITLDGKGSCTQKDASGIVMFTDFGIETGRFPFVLFRQ